MTINNESLTSSTLQLMTDSLNTDFELSLKNKYSAKPLPCYAEKLAKTIQVILEQLESIDIPQTLIEDSNELAFIAERMRDLQ